MGTIHLRIAGALLLIPLLASPLAAGATTVYNVSTIGGSVQSAGNSAGLGSASDLPTMVGLIISVLLGVLGMVFVVLIVYAGFLYLTAQGEQDNVKKAKKLLTQAVIGLVLIVSAYAISLLVTNSLVTITGST